MPYKYRRQYLPRVAAIIRATEVVTDPAQFGLPADTVEFGVKDLARVLNMPTMTLDRYLKHGENQTLVQGFSRRWRLRPAIELLWKEADLEAIRTWITDPFKYAPAILHARTQYKDELKEVEKEVKRARDLLALESNWEIDTVASLVRTYRKDQEHLQVLHDRVAYLESIYFVRPKHNPNSDFGRLKRSSPALKMDHDAASPEQQAELAEIVSMLRGQ